MAHECILDTRPFKASAGVDVEDIAKRIIDYGFHPPTVSFPVAGTLMIEPTESESKEELDRFCDALIAIREEIREIEYGRADREHNLLTNAPHTLEQVIADDWTRPYPRSGRPSRRAPCGSTRCGPPSGASTAPIGDRNLVCTCPPDGGVWRLSGWPVGRPDPAPGWANMAIDQTLLDRAPAGERWLRLYGWAPSCLSFGRHEPATPAIRRRTDRRARHGRRPPAHRRARGMACPGADLHRRVPRRTRLPPRELPRDPLA